MVWRQRTVLTSRRWHHCTVEHRKPSTSTADKIAKAEARIRGARRRLAELQIADADVRPVTTVAPPPAADC